MTTIKKALFAALVAAAIALPALVSRARRSRAPAKPAPAKPAPATPARSRRREAGAASAARRRPTRGVAAHRDDRRRGARRAAAHERRRRHGDAPPRRRADAAQDAPAAAAADARSRSPRSARCKEEVDAYEKGAKDYRDTITTIIKLHYESKKKEVLSGLDREIAIEKAELKKAREIAIKRLEEFVATYSGRARSPRPRPTRCTASPRSTRSARAPKTRPTPLEVGLKPAIALYKRVINEFPKYRELAGIYYFLGHALNDSGRIAEAQQVWRSLVCHNHFPYPTPPDPKDPDEGHDHAAAAGPRRGVLDGVAQQVPATRSRSAKGNPETRLRRSVLRQRLHVHPAAGAARRARTRSTSPRSGGRSATGSSTSSTSRSGVDEGRARQRCGATTAPRAPTRTSMKYKKPPLYGVALYKYAWTLFKQQRYEAATQRVRRTSSTTPTSRRS